jgi:hypothetical protein
MMKKLVLMLVALVAVAGFAFAGGPDCDHKAADAKKHAEGDGHSCAMTEHANCPMKGKKVTETKDVTLTGKLLCRHCNLKQTKTCEKVFQPAGTETLYAVCLGGELAQAEKASEHGEATLEVSGQLVKAEDGSAMLKIASAKKKA